MSQSLSGTVRNVQQNQPIQGVTSLTLDLGGVTGVLQSACIDPSTQVGSSVSISISDPTPPPPPARGASS